MRDKLNEFYYRATIHLTRSSVFTHVVISLATVHVGQFAVLIAIEFNFR